MKKVNVLPLMPADQQQYSTVDVAFLESELNQIFGNINIKS